jgi:hypothetical protein
MGGPRQSSLGRYRDFDGAQASTHEKLVAFGPSRVERWSIRGCPRAHRTDTTINMSVIAA